MSVALKVYLSEQPANTSFGEGALLSNEADGFTIHPTDEPRLTAIQAAGRRLSSQGIPAPSLTGPGWDLEAQWAFAMGYMGPKQTSQPEWWQLDESDMRELKARVETALWVREQVNATPEDLSPVELAERAAKYIESLDPDHVSFELVIGEQLAEQGLVGIHGVGRGSERPPALLVLDYNPSGDADAPVSACLVGKGITFDSGGYSIKTSEGMLAMKMDMGGAAHVTGGLALAIHRGLEHRVKLYLCCAENLISGHAYKLGDILTYKNGTTVEIVNTDAEGRLVLADGLLEASATGAPLIIDAATLTGAAHTAVGNEFHAVFALDKPLLSQVLSVADRENEPHWPLPLEPFHKKKCPSPYADTANSRPVKGGGAGGASNAAGFLARFVREDGKGWVHFDLAGAMMGSDTNLFAAGGTAMGLRTIARLLTDADKLTS